MDISQLQQAVRDTVELTKPDVAGAEKWAATNEGKIPGMEGRPEAVLSAEQQTIDEGLRMESPEAASLPDSDGLTEAQEQDARDTTETPGHAEGISRDTPSPQEVKDASPYSDEVTDRIRSADELEVYKDAGLEEREVNGRTCLTDPNIDPNKKDDFGRTNLERMEQGLPPIGNDGKEMNLHHIGQKPDSPLAELENTDHRKNSSVLHDREASEVDHGNSWAKERSDHWKARAEQYKEAQDAGT
ncbi:MAG TPA: HNH/ENDO VII family nuclease [Candidatus Hydrogenedentes bacterium]|nr:HNH/ENDO VII family nuclease [Candidatus Hydrogenedentota bacterium]